MKASQFTPLRTLPVSSLRARSHNLNGERPAMYTLRISLSPSRNVYGASSNGRRVTGWWPAVCLCPPLRVRNSGAGVNLEGTRPDRHSLRASKPVTFGRSQNVPFREHRAIAEGVQPRAGRQQSVFGDHSVQAASLRPSFLWLQKLSRLGTGPSRSISMGRLGVAPHEHVL